MKNIHLKRIFALMLVTVMLMCAQVGMADESQFLVEEASIDPRPASERQTYERLVDAWAETLEDEEADVVFLGDSITAGGKWQEYYDDYDVENLGVVADYILDVQKRLVLLESLQPDKCFLMVGINDLRKSAEGEEGRILKEYDRLLAELAEMSEDIGMTVYVQSILPFQPGMKKEARLTNAMIRDFNEEIEEMADSYNMTYVDIHSLLTDDEGNLGEEYTSDGLHIYPNAYEVWCEEIRSCVEE